MGKHDLLLLLTIGLLASGAAAAKSSDKPPAQLGLCTACHGVDGVSRAAGTPHMGGQDETYLRTALFDYRSGRRKSSAMNAISNALQADDIDELAAWYAAQTGFVGQKR